MNSSGWSPGWSRSPSRPSQDDPVALALREVQDRVGVARRAVCCRTEDEPVRVGAADQGVAAFAGMQPIMSRTTVEKVVAATPMQPSS